MFNLNQGDATTSNLNLVKERNVRLLFNIEKREESHLERIKSSKSSSDHQVSKVKADSLYCFRRGSFGISKTYF